MMTYTIQHLPQEDRPRERLARYGADSLSLVELLALLLGSGTKETPVLSLAQQIISHFGSLQQLADATLSELCSIKGVGPAKAIQLKAALHLGMRASKQEIAPKYKISHPTQAYEIVRNELENEKREVFIAILLDIKNVLITKEIISIGDLSHTLVHPREVFYSAIRHKAASLIVAHNHPSGDVSPSKADIDLTQNLIQVGKVMSIPLQDHLIVGNQSFLSLREKAPLLWSS